MNCAALAGANRIENEVMTPHCRHGPACLISDAPRALTFGGNLIYRGTD